MALLRDPLTREEILAQEAQMRARDTTAPLRSLIAPEAGYEYGQAVPLRTRAGVIGRTRSGQPIRGQQIQPTVPLALREGASSLLNLAEGTQTGMVNPEDVLNIMPMGAAASLLDEGIDGGFAAGMFIGRSNKRANKGAFDLADDLAAKGESPESIYRKTYAETGSPIYIGRDNIPREEISDAGMLNTVELAMEARRAAENPDDFSAFKLRDVLSDEGFVSRYADAFYREDARFNEPLVAFMNQQMVKDYDGALGGYDRENNVVLLNPSLRNNIPELEKTLIHELEHGAQTQGGLSRGTTPQDAESAAKRMNLASQSMPEAKAARERIAQMEAPREELKDINAADQSKFFKEISLREDAGRMAKYVFNDPEYQMNSRMFIEEIGMPPKRSSKERNDWLNAAAEMLSQRYASKVKNADLLQMNRKDLKNMSARTYRKAYPNNSYEDQALLSRIGSVSSEIGEKLAYPNMYGKEFYDRKLGEMEARATEARLNMSLPERAALFPEASYDLDPRTAIIDPSDIEGRITPDVLRSLLR